MLGKEAIRTVLGVGRPVFEHLPVDPRWTFAEAMEILTHRHEPKSMLHNQGRNRLIEAWATMVGGRRATDELRRTIASYGSVNAATKALRTGIPPKKWTVFSGCLVDFASVTHLEFIGAHVAQGGVTAPTIVERLYIFDY